MPIAEPRPPRVAEPRQGGRATRSINNTILKYKQGGKRTLTLRTFFKIVWGSGWGVKKTTCRGMSRR